MVVVSPTQVHSILRHVAETCGVALEHLYTTIAWPLDKKYGESYEAFRRSVSEPGIFDGLDIAEDVMASMMLNIKRRLTPQPIKVRADIEVRCFSYEGIDAIREALVRCRAVHAARSCARSLLTCLLLLLGAMQLAGQACSTDSVDIKVKLIAPPLYVMLTQSLSKEAALEAVNAAIDATRAVIESKGGKLAVKIAPRVTTQREESDLRRTLAGVAEEENEDDSDGDE